MVPSFLRPAIGDTFGRDERRGGEIGEKIYEKKLLICNNYNNPSVVIYMILSYCDNYVKIVEKLGENIYIINLRNKPNYSFTNCVKFGIMNNNLKHFAP